METEKIILDQKSTRMMKDRAARKQRKEVKEILTKIEYRENREQEHLEQKHKNLVKMKKSTKTA